MRIVQQFTEVVFDAHFCLLSRNLIHNYEIAFERFQFKCIVRVDFSHCKISAFGQKLTVLQEDGDKRFFEVPHMRFAIGNIAGGCLFFKPLDFTLLCNFIEITLRHGCSPVNLLLQNTFSQEHLWVAASDMFDQRIEFSQNEDFSRS